jgi:CMP-N,N'-diacetyllegionaminic acid synthase
MFTTAIIPARSGSKGIKNKNMVLLNGKSLLFHSIDTLLETKTVDRIIVSTDSNEYKESIDDNYGTRNVIVQIRPKELAQDNTTSEEVLVHVVNECEKKYRSDGFLFVQCTSPLTEYSDFENMIEISRYNVYDSCFFYVEDYGYFYELDDIVGKPRLPRQERTPKRRECGNAWFFRKDGFLVHKTRLFGVVGMVKLDPPKHLEIDTNEDLDLISCLLDKRG